MRLYVFSGKELEMPTNEQLLPEQKSALAKAQRKEAPGVRAAPQDALPLDPSSAPRTPGEVVRLQRTVGNRAVDQLIQGKARAGSLQAKLTVGPAKDAFEMEADRVAAQVMNSPAPAAQAQRQEDEDELQMKRVQREAAPEEDELQMKPVVQRQEDEDELQMKPVVQREAAPEEEELQMKSLVQRSADGSFEAGADVEQQLESRKGGGTPLPAETRSFMEPRFGADFSSVRLHTDSGAAQLSQDLQAQAFTRGADIYMGAGKYNPGTSSGNELLAHELTHVVQQGAAQTKKEEE